MLSFILFLPLLIALFVERGVWLLLNEDCTKFNGQTVIAN